MARVGVYMAEFYVQKGQIQRARWSVEYQRHSHGYRETKCSNEIAGPPLTTGSPSIKVLTRNRKSTRRFVQRSAVERMVDYRTQESLLLSLLSHLDLSLQPHEMEEFAVFKMLILQ